MRRVRVLVLPVLALLILVVLAACTSSSSTGTSTGVLNVTVSGLPAGVNAAIVVTGPAAYSTTLTAATTLSNLTPGSYTVTGGMARSPGAIVDAAYRASGGGSVMVSAGSTATSSVTYSFRQGSGKLWIADRGGQLDGLDASQLTGSGSPAPAVSLSNANSPNGLAFDANGNLWVGLTGTKSVVEYSASQLKSTATPTPNVTIGSDGASLPFPTSLAFDSQGDLWVGNCFSGGSPIEMYTPTQLATSASPTPSVSIIGSFTTCASVAFDAQGDLWVGDVNNDQVLEFTPSQLAVSGSPVANVKLTSSAFTKPEGLAFDANGNLWVANNGSTGATALVMFTPSQIAAGGAQTPTVNLSDDGSGNLSDPVYVTLDESGDLWVTTYTNNTVLEFLSADIKSSGTPAAAVVLSGFSSFIWPQLSFNPPAVVP